MAALKFLTGPRANQRVELGAEQTLLGRTSFCDIVLDVRGVSRQHARISRVDDRFAIEDLESVNGTYVNRQRLHGRRILQHLDRIHVFSVVAIFLADGAAAVTELTDDTTAALAVGPKADVVHAVAVDGAERSDPSTHAQLLAILAITRELATSLDLDEMLPRLLDSLFKVFPQARNGHVMLLDPVTGELTPHAIQQGREGTGTDTFRPISRTIVDRVMHDGQAVLSIADSDKLSVLDETSLWSMCAPLIGPSRKALGVVYLESGAPNRPFTAEDLELLASAAMAAGQMVEHTREHESSLKLARRERDLVAAREMQLKLLPQSRPSLPGYQFDDFYRAAEEVGGDYFGYLPLEGGRWCIAVGDVAGKGMSAALMMARLTAEVRYCLAISPTPAEAVNRLNLAFPDSGHRFITFALCVLDPALHELTVVIAGHMPPLWRRAQAGLVEPIGGDAAGPPLGAAGQFEYEQVKVVLQPGDSVLLYTDGISECYRDRQATDRYGVQKIQEVLLAGPAAPARAIPFLLKDVARFTHGEVPADDACLVCFGREAV